MADILSQEELDLILDSDEQSNIDMGIRKYFDRILEIEEQYKNSKIFKTKELAKLEGNSFSIVNRTFDNLHSKLTKGEIHPRHYILLTIMILKDTLRVSRNYAVNRWNDKEGYNPEEYENISKKIDELMGLMSNM